MNIFYSLGLLKSPLTHTMMKIGNYTALLQLENELNNTAETNRVQALEYETSSKNATTSIERKRLRGLSIVLKTDNNVLIRKEQQIIADKIWDRLNYIEQYKVDGYLPNNFRAEVKNLYLLLSRQGRLNVRYLKLPKAWISIGMYAGILEELIVILRTPSQVGMGNKHFHTVVEVINAIEKVHIVELEGNRDIRFLFLTKLINQSVDNSSRVVCDCITFQGPSKRIGMYYVNGTLYIYAIQGIYGSIPFDSRVVKTITPKIYSRGANIPKIGIHFTKMNIAKAIWNKEETTAQRSRDEELTPGSICKFDRPIHALTWIHVDIDGLYRINKDKIGIRDRMVHGINDKKERVKYQAGLIIDIEALCTLLPYGSVQLNELGTLLVHTDIPQECLIDCLYTDAQLDTFWGIN